MFISLLNEFVPIPVITIFGLFHFFKIIKNDKKTSAFVIYCIGNIAILAYLLWFTYLLKTVGNSNFSNSSIFPYLYNDSLAMTFSRYLLFFLEFFLSVNLLPLLTVDSRWAANLVQVQTLMHLILPIIGFFYIQARKELRPIFYFTVLFFVLLMALEFFTIVPINFLRRQECFVFCILILNYYSYISIFRSFAEKLSKYAPLIMVIASVFITTTFVFNDFEIRKQKRHEFNFTEAGKKQIFEFLDKNVGENDIIITDWLSYLFFYDDYKGNDAEKYSDTLKVYKGYKVPLYYFDYDYRNSTVYFSTSDIQNGIKEIAAKNGSKTPGKIWIVEFQHAFFTSDLSTLTGILSSEEAKVKYAKEMYTLEQQHNELRSYLHGNAEVRFHQFASENCPKKYQTDVQRVEKCVVKNSILGFDGKKLTEYMQNMPLFLNPNAVYEKIRRNNSEK